ncbi:MAG: O-antigen ligase family protein [Actinomycetota bacterium]|nr:O-antigen ligase family protein [Actinomycetota bacterium]
MAIVGSDHPSSHREDGSTSTASRRPGVIRVGLVFTYLACLTVPWTAVGLGPIRLGDIFLVMGLAAIFAADLAVTMPRIPAWVWLFAGTILLVGMIHEVFPVSPDYLAQRLLPQSNGVVLRGSTLGFSNGGVMIKFLIPVVGLPLLFGLAYTYDRRALTRCAVSFAAGAAVSGLIAFTDVEGLTAIAAHVTGFAAAGGRGTGLTEQSNYVAMASVFGLPIMLWKVLADSLRVRVWAALGVAALLAGLYASGSRSGAGAGAAAIALSVVLLPRFRRVLPFVALLGGIVLTLGFVIHPAIGDNILRALRLNGGQTAGSDLGRTIINTQAAHDFGHSPIYGIGLEVAGEAHIVYLQALAAGGIVLLTGYVVFHLGALVRSLAASRTQPLAAALFVSVLAGIVFNAEQDALTLRIVYLPASLAAALLETSGPTGRGPDRGVARG